MDKRKRPYIVKLKVSGEELTSSGRTFEDALFGLKIGKLTTKGILSVKEKGKESKPVVLSIPQIKKMFVYGLSGDIQRAVTVKKIKLLGGI